MSSEPVNHVVIGYIAATKDTILDQRTTEVYFRDFPIYSHMPYVAQGDMTYPKWAAWWKWKREQE